MVLAAVVVIFCFEVDANVERNPCQDTHVVRLMSGVTSMLGKTEMGAKMTGDKSVSGGSKKCLIVRVLDIGQGDSISITAPNGNSMLIDAGPADGPVLERLSESLGFFDRTIDVLLPTHVDADHIGGMQQVLGKYKTSLWFESGVRSDTQLSGDMDTLVSSMKLPKVTAVRGERIILDKDNDVEFTVLSPDDDFYLEAYKKCEMANIHKNLRKELACEKDLIPETNTSSIVGRLTYGITSFMMTADSPIPVEDFLIDHVPLDELRSDVLKVGHHGSKNSTSPEYLEAVSPSYAVISVGVNNRYGHPNQIVLDNLKKYGEEHPDKNLKVTRTDQSGTITFVSDGTSVFESP